MFRREALPGLPGLEREWRTLETVGHPSFFTSWHWIGTLLAALPPASRPKLLRGTAHGQTVSLALLGANETRRRRGLVRSRGLYLNETGDPHFDALTIEHNGILAAAEWERVVWEELIGWFASLRGEADELHIGGSQRRLPEAVLHGWGLGCRETSLPSYSVDLCRLEDSDGELYPVLSANARQQLRHALRYFERFGALRLVGAATVAEALTFFEPYEGIALRVLGAARQVAFLLRRLLRAVPPAADRAQLCRRAEPSFSKPAPATECSAISITSG